MKANALTTLTLSGQPSARQSAVNTVNAAKPEDPPPMQPPRMRPWLLQQIDDLKAQASRQAEVTPSSMPPPKNPCPPVDYKTLIQRWYDMEAPALRQRKYSMSEFILRFTGRFRPKPAARLVAEALRELGWTEHRDWTRAGRNRRYWRPPINLPPSLSKG